MILERLRKSEVVLYVPKIKDAPIELSLTITDIDGNTAGATHTLIRQELVDKHITVQDLLYSQYQSMLEQLIAEGYL